MRKIEINTGDKFGRLEIIKEVDRYLKPSGQPVRQFLCKCECGVEKIIKFDYLRCGSTKSCGCYNIELIKERSIKHGKTGTTEYRSWMHMKERCYNPNTHQFKYWGGRGIKVCDRWLESFQNFIDDMGHKPSKTHSLDRIDFNGNYEPSNCRWATPNQQSQNRRGVKINKPTE